MTTSDSTNGANVTPAITDVADDETEPGGEDNERVATARIGFRDVGFIENHNERFV